MDLRTAYYSYQEVNVRARNGECDIGWSPFWILAQRERCFESVYVSLNLHHHFPELPHVQAGGLPLDQWFIHDQQCDRDTISLCAHGVTISMLCGLRKVSSCSTVVNIPHVPAVHTFRLALVSCTSILSRMRAVQGQHCHSALFDHPRLSFPSFTSRSVAHRSKIC